MFNFKSFSDDDIATTKTLLHENIPLTGSLLNGSLYVEDNTKSFGHGMFQSVYDYPYLSSSANQLFDITAGFHKDSPVYNESSPVIFQNKKLNIYNQFAQVLAGFAETGSILQFDKSGNPFSSDLGDKFTSAFFLNFNRLLSKDEIKKGSFKLTLGVGQAYSDRNTQTCLISDVSGSSNYFINSPTGEYGILYVSASAGGALNDAQPNKQVGLIFYQAGIAVISSCIFATYNSSNSPETDINNNSQGQLDNLAEFSASVNNIGELFTLKTIDDINSNFLNRIVNLTFNNTTELNSTIHFCRINHNEFNYSSNPTYTTGSKIRVKNNPNDAPISYITTVGLYSPDNELLAVAKLSEPLKKDPTQEMILRVRLDY